jgi:hypothetical protein
LDYAKVKMIGTGDFRKPDEIFPQGLNNWNGLFLKEMFPKLESLSPGAVMDIKAVTARNETAKPEQIIREDGSTEQMVKPTTITEADIASMVKAYDLKEKQGIGLVFVMDRLVKLQNTECFYVVFFDVASRKVLASERLCHEARGAGFRNFWFNPIKVAVEKTVPGMLKKAKAARR